MYEVEITPEGLRHLRQLPEKVAAAALELILGAMATEPQRVGKPKVGDLTGLHSARRGDYRVIYEVDDATRTVLIHRIEHRRHVYRARGRRRRS